MFIVFDKVVNQGLKQVIIVVFEKLIGVSFNNELLSCFGFWVDWMVVLKWNFCNVFGEDGGKVKFVGVFFESDDKFLVCMYVIFWFVVDKYGIEVFDDCLIVIDEFYYVFLYFDNKFGLYFGQFVFCDCVYVVVMIGLYFCGDVEVVMVLQDEVKFDMVIYIYYE